ncbi:hypothetical protein PtA15_1A409 [Puccinia triticina]|uniref:Uncharacterized protein n=1 Tax=Puccinia triticina TaxID=208348 RepID=A0ABY7CA84_9BASI|nr:uncharacterized protein PtA15_1A409 [Puccinia triticina]WAQ81071.1 hypothetical protein PtA15_1A409 [Puccinia triticina]WAR51964.1 hypothetical protein PtB15_1B401 [Puccinia triticina]
MVGLLFVLAIKSFGKMSLVPLFEYSPLKTHIIWNKIWQTLPPSTFGALNGLAQVNSFPFSLCDERLAEPIFPSSLSRPSSRTSRSQAWTFGPFITKTLVSISIKEQYLDGNLIWLCQCGFLHAHKLATRSSTSVARAQPKPFLIQFLSAEYPPLDPFSIRPGCTRRRSFGQLVLKIKGRQIAKYFAEDLLSGLLSH